ncbi:MAG: hypothetical protein ACTSYA_01860 [Candidatus Kariarchaeaceae archaeon]
MISLAAVVGGLLFKSGINSFEIEIGFRLFILLSVVSMMIFFLKLAEQRKGGERIK